MVTVNALECPLCKDKIFSRSHHDWRQCSCGRTFVDGGFDYIRCGWTEGFVPKQIKLKIKATKEELYWDWNNRKDKFGLIKPKKSKKK